MERTLTQEEALALFETRWWEGKEPYEIVLVQLFTDRLIMPFGDFHKAVEDALGRPVWTHEFAYDGLKKEFLGERKAPTFDEIVGLLPADKVIIVEAGS
jgi:hypothetical protein